MKLCGLADHRVAMLERRHPGGQVLDARDRQLRTVAEDDLQRTREQALRNGFALGAFDLGPARYELFDDRRVRAFTQSDEGSTDERPIRNASLPANDDRVGEPDAVRDVEANALIPERAGKLGQLVVRGQ